MAYQSLSFVAGEVPTTATWNILNSNDASFANGSGIANLEVGGITAVKNDYKFRCYRNASLTSPNDTIAVVNFDTKTGGNNTISGGYYYDTGGNLDVVTNPGRFTAPVAGFYRFDSAISFTSGGTLAGSIGIYVNGHSMSPGIENTPQSTNAFTVTCGDTLQLLTNDYVEIYIFTNTPTSVVVGPSAVNFFSGHLVSNT